MVRSVSRRVNALEKKGYIRSEHEPSPTGTKRKLYIGDMLVAPGKPVDKKVHPHPTKKSSAPVDKKVHHNNNTDTSNSIDNSTSTIIAPTELEGSTPTGLPAVPQETTPPTPSPTGEIVEGDKSNKEVTEVIEAIKNVLQSNGFEYKVIRITTKDHETGRSKTITDRFLISNILRTTQFKELCEKRNKTAKELLPLLVLYSIKRKRGGVMDDAVKISRNRLGIYNEVVKEKLHQQKSQQEAENRTTKY